MRGAALLLLTLVAAALAGAEGERAPLEGRALFEARCSACHDPSRVDHRIADRDEWREIVFRMQRMPQSGITPEEAERIVDYLAGGGLLGGRKAWGEEWISVLETAVVTAEGARLGGRVYAAEVREGGREVTLVRGGKRHVVSLDAKGKPAATAVVRRWKIGRVVYEVHLILYEVRDGEPRVGRALRRRS